MHTNRYPKGASEILRFVKKIDGVSFVQIFKAEGCIVMQYDDVAKEIYESKPVMVMRFNDMTFGQWKEEIESFIKYVREG